MKRVLLILLTICLLLTSGCAGTNSGAVSDKVTKVKDVTVTPAEWLYTIDKIEFPQDIWFSNNNIVVTDDKIYLLGSFLEEYFLFCINPDGTDARMVASSSNEKALWQTYCSFENKIYIYDRLNNKLILYSNSGDELGRIGLPEDMTVDKLIVAKGQLYALGGGRLTRLKIDEKEAKPDYTLKVSEGASFGVNSNEDIIVAWHNEGGQAISVLDDNNRSWSETHYLDTNCTICGTGSEWELYLIIGNALYGYDFSSETIKKLISFSDIGLLGNGMICEMESGKLLYTGNNGHEATKPVIIKPITKSNENVKIILATLGELHPTIQKAILIWNQSHPDILVEIRDYSAYTTTSDSRGGEYKLIADIAAGDGPDIFNLSDFGTAINASTLARRNLLEDLYPFIDQDKEVSRADFITGPLKSLEINDALYQITPGFLVLTATASSRDVGTDNWTFDQLEQIVANNDQYQYLFDNTYPRNDWLEIMIVASGKKLVDWTNAQCHFDSKYFVDLLNMAYLRPIDTDTSGGSLIELINNSHSLLFMQTFRNVWEAGSVADVYGANNCAFVGIPETGNVMIPELSLGISSQSTHKEQCWQFLREFLLKDSPFTSGIPLRRDGAEQQMLDEIEAMKEYPVEHPGRVDAMQVFLSALENVNTLYQSDPPLWRIIYEEVSKYYCGDRTAEETAKAIQSRASLYLSEQS